jgi:hypothetical protein
VTGRSPEKMAQAQMNDLTTTTNGIKAAKKERLSRNIVKAIELLASGACASQRAAATRLGISEAHLCRELQKSKYQSFPRNRTLKTLRGAVPKAAAKLVELLDCPSWQVQEKAAARLLAIDGISPPDRPSITVNVGQPGYIIDLSGDRDRKPEPKLIDVTPNPEGSEE